MRGASAWTHHLVVPPKALDKHDQGLNLRFREHSSIARHADFSLLVALDDLRTRLEDRLSEVVLVGGDPHNAPGESPLAAIQTSPCRPELRERRFVNRMTCDTSVGLV